MISAAMGDTKAGNAEKSGAEYVTSTDPSCLMQVEGILRRRNSSVRTIHLASILAQTGERRAKSSGRGGRVVTAAQDFLRSAAVKSADLVHRQILRRGIDHYDAAVREGPRAVSRLAGGAREMPEHQARGHQSSRSLSGEFRAAREGARRAGILGRERRRSAALYSGSCCKSRRAHHREIEIHGGGGNSSHASARKTGHPGVRDRPGRIHRAVAE